MRDRALILGGLVIFLALITFPIWFDLAGGKTARAPDIKLPPNQKACVAPTDFMRSSHMSLLIEWREAVVRQGLRTYTAFDGRTYTMSLTGTCLKQCHTSKADFCDRCHNYAGVKTPYCWDCHVDPATVPQAAPQVAAGGRSEVHHE
jgi:hypothetical protein